VTTDNQKVEQLKHDPEIKKALSQTASTGELAKPNVKTRHKVFLSTYVVALLALAGAYYISRLGFLSTLGAYLRLFQRLTLGGMAAVTVLAIARSIDVYFIDRLEDPVSEYNLHRILKLSTLLVLGFLLLSVLFANWYTAVVSLGLVSLILGFALQTPITSFIGWIYILVREPYRVGDRIKIDGATGDVIDVGYFDTTLWEFGGDFLSTDHPSGRVIKFPNSKVLNSAVYNYSWPLFPYIWNEIKFQVAYEADLRFIADTMRQVAEEDRGQAMLERVGIYRHLLSETPVDQLEVKEHPVVLFRVNENTWLEAICRYLVQPRQAGSVKSRLIEKMLARLNDEPERVLFPKSNAR
jgi:small-conductance mechanosensitive channel